MLIPATISEVARLAREVEEKDISDAVLMERIQSVTQDAELPEVKNVRTFYKYLMQNLVQNRDKGIGEILLLTSQNVDEFHERFKWADPEVIEEKKVEEKPRRVTKKSRAVEIFAEHFGKKTPKEIQVMFREELDMSVLGARTYYYTIKGELGW